MLCLFRIYLSDKKEHVGLFFVIKTGFRQSLFKSIHSLSLEINPYPTAFPYGNGMVLHFYQQQESSTTKTVHKVINKGLKAYVQSPHTGENFH